MLEDEAALEGRPLLDRGVVLAETIELEVSALDEEDVVLDTILEVSLVSGSRNFGSKTAAFTPRLGKLL